MKSKICCFAGHREIYNTDKVYNDLLCTIENLILDENVLEFWVGNYGVFDKLSKKAVNTLKSKYHNIKLNLVIPYLTNSVKEIKTEFDNIIIADIKENTPRNLKIIKCNEYMIKNSEYLICYVFYNWGGANKTLEFAQKNKNVKIYNLYKA